MKNKVLKNTLTGLAAIGGIGALAAGYAYAVRPWHLRWGATDDELTEAMPGDDIKPDPADQVTHAVTIDAPPTEVWKWLVQVGQDRGGFYSYDWLENLFGVRVCNTKEIKPEWQELKVGDFVRGAQEGWMGGRFDSKAGWFVTEIEPNRSLVLRDEIEHGSWAFVLKPVAENQTRLVIRARGNHASTFGQKLFHYGFLEPAHFIMERKMLLTLKQKAEASFGRGTPAPLPLVSQQPANIH